MKRFIKVDNDELIEAQYVAKFEDDASDTTITVNWDTAADGVETFTVTGKAGNAYPKPLSTRLTTPRSLSSTLRKSLNL